MKNEKRKGTSLWTNVLIVTGLILMIASLFPKISYANEKAEANEIKQLVSDEVISGLSLKNLEPEQEITRHEAVEVIANSLGWEAKNDKLPYKDVSKDDKEFDAIAAAYERNVLDGMDLDTDSFYPNEKISRVEMADLLERAYHIAGPFNKSINELSQKHWAYKALEEFIQNGKSKENAFTFGFNFSSMGSESQVERKHFGMMMVRSLENSFGENKALEEVTMPFDLRVKDDLDFKSVPSVNMKEPVELKNPTIQAWINSMNEDVTVYEFVKQLSIYQHIFNPVVGGLEGKVIVLDAGHGGKDGGATFDGLLEKEINLKTVGYLKSQLEDRGAEVIMTRDSDEFLTLDSRAYFSRGKGADIFISLHSNASGEHNVHGTETYYNATTVYGTINTDPKDSKALAEAVQGQVKELPTKDLGYKDAGYVVLRKNSLPSILIETGFVDHEADRKYLSDNEFLKDMAEKISAGVADYFAER